MQVIDTIGSSPEFWDRNVIFVANLMGLFFENEEETQMLAEEVGEVASYGGRLLPMLDLVYRGGGTNHLVLEREPDPTLVRYFLECGLTLPEFSVLPHADYLRWGEDGFSAGPRCEEIARTIAEHPAAFLDGYVTDRILSQLAEQVAKKTCSTPRGSRSGNNKFLLHQHLAASGLPVPGTELAGDPGEIDDCLSRLAGKGYSSAVIRAAIGASGIGMVKVPVIGSGAVAVPQHFFSEGPCLVQGWLKPGEFGITEVRSPSVQLFLSDDEVRMFDMTEQILSAESIHEGNESPPFYLGHFSGLKEELLRQAGLAGSWLHGQGYRGTASVDFLVTSEGEDRFTVYVCEINARVTGATYPSVLARHFLPDGAWLLRNLRFHEPLSGEELIDLMRTSGDLFIPGQSEFGIFPVNFNFGEDGKVHKGQFLCLSASRLSNRMLLQVAELDLPCTPERD